MKHRKYLLYAFCCLALLLIIFIFSHQPGELSYAISDHIGELIKQFAADLSIHLPKLNIRKIAHIAIFFLLGFSCTLMFSSFLKHKNIYHPILISLVFSFAFCTAAAAFDEWHQTFIPGRTGQIKDIFIDLAGFGTAIILTEIINLIIVLFGRSKNER